MKPEPQFLPPAQSVVYAYTRRMLEETATNAQSFAVEVAERYLAMTSPSARAVPFKTSETDPAAAMRHNGQILRRYLDGAVKTLPADLVDAWVLALPDPYRCECERDLARRRGLLAVRAIDAGDVGAAASLADLAVHFAELMRALAPAMADGVINEADLPHVRAALNESDDLITAVVSIRRPLQALLPTGESHV
ncbi:hypothetical protein [Xanthomonas sp. XNM01]|uniref:hypothetical protein n=1 Tax=Xanthomonas sp. XNM01 TaxID=2769289 RepID=UPI00177EFC2F|nr:hypothetical protein [Xanthomonas sp. XNM01]MBD9368839.1 hypothetical protein [Xanthomonas sp. XNM01]